MSNHGFTALNLSPLLLKAIRQLGYKQPTAIQLQAIPVIISGRDLRAKAQTGSGKTAAFGLPLLQKLLQQRERPKRNFTGNQVSVLILAPTRELTQQIEADLKMYASEIMPRFKILGCVGGVNITPQMLALRGGADVLVATPGRLLDLVQQNAVKFSQLISVVLDEADQLLQLGFSEELSQIISLLPEKRQSLLFSATFSSDLNTLISGLLVKPVQIDCELMTDLSIQQRVLTITQERKNALLARLIHDYNFQRVLVFANAKNTCNRLVLKLEKANIKAAALHSDKTQAARMEALRNFKQGRYPVLIATDLAARGIDIEGLAMVINFDLPRSPNDYIHRIGRTGRAGHQGCAVSLLVEEDEAHFRVIEKRIKMRLMRESGEDMLATASKSAEGA